MIDRHRLNELRPVIEQRLTEFSAVPRSKWQRELIICLMTPQSSPFRAESALRKMEEEGLFEGALTEKRVAKILRNPAHYVRFHNVKATRIVQFVKRWEEVRGFIEAGEGAETERENLTKHVNGFSLKEASHALRNIGRRNLAILDRHILKHLVRNKVIVEVPTTLTPKRYLEIEKRFRDFAAKQGENMDTLDLFFWASETGAVFKSAWELANPLSRSSSGGGLRAKPRTHVVSETSW